MCVIISVWSPDFAEFKNMSPKKHTLNRTAKWKSAFKKMRLCFVLFLFF